MMTDDEWDLRVDAHIKALQDFLEADREQRIAREQRRADSAAERGDTKEQRRHLGYIDELRARLFSWERQAS